MPYTEVRGALLHYRKYGHSDTSLLLLHAGWGLAINGFSYQESELADRFTLIVPDRRGYGRSSLVASLPADFHWQAADDMYGLLDVLETSKVYIWGHSDGAVIGAIMAILQPTRVLGLIFEGGHFYNRKPYSQDAFESLYRDPMLLPQATQHKLAKYHGQTIWQRVIRNWAGAWLELGKREGDLYQGRLGEIFCPCYVMLGGRDEHTSVAEMEKLVQQVHNAKLSISIYAAGHCVHDDRASFETCTQDAVAAILNNFA